MKIVIFRGDLTDISAKTEALVLQLYMDRKVGSVATEFNMHI